MINLGKRIAKQQGYERKRPQLYIPRKWFVLFLISFSALSVITFSGSKIKPLETLDPSKAVSYQANINESAISVALNQLKTNPESDFDRDGLENAEEAKYGTDPYNADTDGDGMTDGAEIYDTVTSPTTPDEFTYIAAQSKQKGEKVNMPFELNGVVLWADDMDSKTYASVVKTPEGYLIRNFTGWVQFKEEGIPYAKYSGARTELRTNTLSSGTKVYYIDRNCTVELHQEPLHPIGQLSLFGNKQYVSNNKFAETVLSFMLPEDGPVSYRAMMREDTEPDTREDVITKQLTPVYELKEDRFDKNDNSKEALTQIKASINNDMPVIISLFSPAKGEAILMIYGYTPQGHLLVADPETQELMGMLFIQQNGQRTLAKGNTLGYREWFGFFGCGFYSWEGDRISIIESMPAQQIIQTN